MENIYELKERMQKIALFRHSIISPVLNDREEGQNKYFREMAEKEHFIPGVGMKKFSVSTFKSWLSAYREKGYEGIKPRVRKDKGKSRKISPKFKGLIEQTIRGLPVTTYTALYRYLIDEGYISYKDFTIQTFVKYIKDNNIVLKKKEIVPRKKFEARHINQLWTCDFMHSIFIRDGKKKRQTYLCAIIDDHSRVIVGHLWSFDSRYSTLETTFKGAILSFGLPQKFYCDNGKVFRSDAINLACARLGIALIHSRPFDSPSRGKIERFFRTVQSSFLPLVDRDKIKLQELNSSFDNWISLEYNKKFHQGIGQTPMEKYMKDIDNVAITRVMKENLDLIFYRTTTRKVKQDSTVSVEAKLYEAPAKYIGTEVELRYPASSPEEIYIFEDDKPAARLRLLDVHENAEAHHISMSYSNLFNREIL